MTPVIQDNPDPNPAPRSRLNPGQGLLAGAGFAAVTVAGLETAMVVSDIAGQKAQNENWGSIPTVGLEFGLPALLLLAPALLALRKTVKSVRGRLSGGSTAALAAGGALATVAVLSLGNTVAPSIVGHFTQSSEKTLLRQVTLSPECAGKPQHTLALAAREAIAQNDVVIFDHDGCQVAPKPATPAP